VAKNLIGKGRLASLLPSRRFVPVSDPLQRVKKMGRSCGEGGRRPDEVQNSKFGILCAFYAKPQKSEL
jgi:hypothetical protein